MAKIKKVPSKTPRKKPVKKPAKKVEPEETFNWEDVDGEAEEKPKKKRKESELGPPVYKYRFVASLQDAKKSNLYREFVESNTLTEIKKKSEKEVAAAFKEDGMDLGVLVMDREGWFTTYRYNLPAQANVEKDHKGNVKITNDTETRIKSWVKDK
jgi:hypothetical protein